MNEVRLTLESFLSLCKLTLDVIDEKERLRKIVVMQNDALEKLASKSKWTKEYHDWLKSQEATAKPKRDKHTDAFWPPLGMIP